MVNEARRKNCKKRKLENQNPEDQTNNRIKKFRNLCWEGPTFVCVVCNRCLYRNGVELFDSSKYDFDTDSVIHKVDIERSWVCCTCDKLLKKKQIPGQTVINKLEISASPDVLISLNRLERVLMSKRILFKKVTIMPKGDFPKLKGSICNVPIDTVDISDELPRSADSNGLVVIKLKRKLTYRGHVYFEAVRPELLNQALMYLKENNPLYSDVSVNISNIPNNLLPFANDDIPGPSGTAEDSEEIENPLDLHRFNSQETMFVPNLLTGEKINIAPGDRKQPTSILSDTFCEQLAFLYLFPQRKFGYNIERDVKLSPIKSTTHKCLPLILTIYFMLCL